MDKTMSSAILVSFLFFVVPSLAFSAKLSAYDRIAVINSSLDDFESSEVKEGASSVSNVPSVQAPVVKKAPIVTKYARKRGSLARGSGSSSSAVAEGWKKAFKVSGEVKMGVGVEDNNVFGMTADGNLNERNWRIIDDRGLNRTENTFDPGVYSRLKVVLDAVIEDSVRMHLNVTVDPWSYTGKSSMKTVMGTWGDSINIQYLTWGNNPYTIARTYNGMLKGDSTNIGEIKVKGRKVPALTVRGAWENQWGQYATWDIPEMKMDYTFNPLRELWFDFKTGDKGYIRVFPMAYDNQALTSDDPLHLSNNKSYWEESPWLQDWTRGNYNALATTPLLVSQPSFTKGMWDRSFANYSRDSDGTWLTALRGVTLDMKTNEEGTLKAVVATPKTLWQDYGDVTAVPGSIRLKQFVADRLFVGLTGNMHIGIVDNHRIDAENYVKSADMGVVPLDGMEINAQVSSSDSVMDQTNSTYKSRKHGDAYFVSMELASEGEDVLNKDYFGLVAPKGAPMFAKTRFFFGKMEDTFESSLANYHATRDDMFWSRHLTFYPSPYRNMPGTAPTMSHYDMEPFALGNGLDYGRKVFGWRGDVSLFEDRLKGLGDTRYVMTDDKEGKKIEAVSRTQWEYMATDKLVTKMLLLHHGLPKTTAGKDPFIVSGNTAEPLDNTAVAGGDDPSLNTGTLGLRYQLTDRVAWNGVWERTNDFTEATDSFPNGIFNSGYNGTYAEDGRIYSASVPFLYSQGYFDQAPYAYHNIVKTGIEFKPSDQWDIYIDYTRNPNKFAGNIDDNSNHVGIESSYRLNEKWGFFTRYTYSRMYDLYTLVNDDVLDYHSYHNFYAEARYCHTKRSKLSLMYGVGPAYNIGVQGINPSLAYYSTPSVETQHIVRMIYQQKF
ncbi:MAG: hypothetical protein HQL21_04520 [Candidatus Omnitrophica bacterium]|nr:hypothetical protein [Candidatus Omnitrophota bacterium]